MPEFWSYVTRGKYSVGCTGQSVYVFENGDEVLRLKGFRYTYNCCISPDLEYFAVKSAVGIMYIYSLRELVLLEKVRFMKADESQDHMFTFSQTGNEIISVDDYGGFHHCISYYSVPTLELKQRLFDGSDITEPCVIELTDRDNEIYALMWERNGEGIVDRYSVALIVNKELREKVYITEGEHELYSGFIDLRRRGFTEKAKKWSPLKYEGFDASNIESRGYSLARLFEHYTKKQ